MIVGHVMIPLAMAMKQLFDPPLSLQFAIWAPTIALATFLLLPLMKGAIVSLLWVKQIYGFAGPDTDPQADV